MSMNTVAHSSPSDWVDLVQAEREGPFSKRTLWHFISDGKLAAYRPLKKKVLIRRSELHQLIEAARI